MAVLVCQMNNPFNFKHITELKTTGHLDDVGACVVLATPSMLQARLPTCMPGSAGLPVQGLRCTCKGLYMYAAL